MISLDEHSTNFVQNTASSLSAEDDDIANYCIPFNLDQAPKVSANSSCRRLCNSLICSGCSQKWY